MIKYALICDRGHEFEAWFRSSDAYERQARRRLVACPDCGSVETEKRPMAPSLVRSGERRKDQTDTTPSSPVPAPLEMLRAFKRHVLANSEDVGPRFADEARKIHYGDTQARAIRGETSRDEARQLHEEGVEFGVLPVLPEDRN